MTCFPNPDDKRAFGIDVSRYNLVDWQAVANFGAPPATFCAIRSGQAHKGAFDDIDRRFFHNWANAEATLGLDKMMPYHVHYPASPIKPQVDNIERIFSLIGYDFGAPPFWLDMELDQGCSGAKIVDTAYEMLCLMEERFGIEVGIYTGLWFLNKFKVPARPWWKDVPWWLAQYGKIGECAFPLVIPKGILAENILYHQTTSDLEGMLFGAPLGTRVDGSRRYEPVVIPPPVPSEIQWSGTVTANALTVFDAPMAPRSVVRYLVNGDKVDVYAEALGGYVPIAANETEWVNVNWLKRGE